jgi:hypothetical protein
MRLAKEAPMYLTQLSQDAKIAINVSRKKHWGFRVLEGKGMFQTPTYKDEWWFIPVEDDSTIPRDGLNRIRILKSNGVGIREIVIAHEAPLLLPAPKPEKKPINFAEIATVTGKLLMAMVYVAGLTVALMGYVISTALMIDPALIIVLEEDGTRIEVMRWLE